MREVDRREGQGLGREVWVREGSRRVEVEAMEGRYVREREAADAAHV